LLRVAVLLNGAGEPILLLLMLLLLLVIMLLLPILLLLNLLVIASHTLEVRAGKGTGTAGLEGAAEEQLRGKQRRKLHVESCTRSGHLGDIDGSLLRLRRLLLLKLMLLLLLLVHRLGINAGNVTTSRMSISEPADVGGEGAMRETRVAVGRLRNMSVTATRCTGAVLKTQVLHPEQMRRD
jgi:hypothetical protein